MISLNVRKSKRCAGEYSIFASFPYDVNIVSIFRKLHIRYYDPDSKEWEVPADQLNTLLSQLNSNYKYVLKGLEYLQGKEEVKIPGEFHYKTKPFKHQEDGIKFGLSHDRWLLGDTMGLGKTKCAIDLAVIKKIEKGYDHCLIVCGVNSLKWNWLSEVEKHSDENGYILGQRKGNSKITNKNKLDDAINLANISEYFIITNIETLRNEEIVRALAKQCDTKNIGMIVLDEAHVCKDPSSQQGKGMLKLHANTMLAMTGTPLMNSPVDLYFLLKWLGYEKHNFYAFKNYYCIMGGYGGYQIVGYKNLEQLQDQLNSFMLRRLKEDVFDLPDKIYVDEYVEMGSKQKQIYDEVTQEIKLNIDKIVMSPNPLTELIRMRQATGYTGILSSQIKESAKFERVIELLREAKSNHQKVVLFTNWTQILEPLEHMLHKEGFKGYSISGETDSFIRQERVDAFQKNRDIDFILGTIGAMGTGITLTAGTIEIFLDEPWNMALKEQAVDRCHRIGTKSNVTIYTLLAKNTIDEKIHKLIEKKGLMADALIDGRIISDKRTLLNYLLS